MLTTPATPRAGRLFVSQGTAPPAGAASELVLISQPGAVENNQSSAQVGELARKLGRLPFGFMENVSPSDADHVSSQVLSVLDKLRSSTKAASNLTLHTIEVKRFGRTHYSVIIIDESIVYTMEFLADVLYNRNTGDQNFGVKHAYINPRAEWATLDSFKNSNIEQPCSPCVAALIVEVWTLVEARKRSTIVVDAIERAQSLAVVSTRGRSHSGAPGSIVIKAGTELHTTRQRLPEMVVRVTDFEPIRRFSAQGFQSDRGQLLLDAACGMLASLHKRDRTSTAWDVPSEFNYSPQAAIKQFTVAALGYSADITLDDMLAVYYTDPTLIKDVKFDCSVVPATQSSSKPFPHGGLSITVLVPDLDEPTRAAVNEELDARRGANLHQLLSSGISLLSKPQERASGIAQSMFVRVDIHKPQSSPMAVDPQQQPPRAPKRSARAAELDVPVLALPAAAEPVSSVTPRSMEVPTGKVARTEKTLPMHVVAPQQQQQQPSAAQTASEQVATVPSDSQAPKSPRWLSKIPLVGRMFR